MELENFKEHLKTILDDSHFTKHDLLKIRAQIVNCMVAHLEELYPQATILTLEEFCEECADGNLTPYDENLYFYDGSGLTDKCVWDESWTHENINMFEFVIWCNKERSESDAIKDL